jgi:hypothetical protein
MELAHDHVHCERCYKRGENSVSVTRVVANEIGRTLCCMKWTRSIICRQMHEL